MKCSLAYLTVEYTDCEVPAILFCTICIENFCNICLFIRSPIHTFKFEMSLQLKKKKRSANLRKNEDFSSEDDVKIVSNESKKIKTVLTLLLDEL